MRDPNHVQNPKQGKERKRRVLVTGASGHLGFYLVSELNQAGVIPHVLTRRERSADDWGELRVEPIVADLLEASSEEMAEYLAGFDTVYHLAALVSLFPRDAAAIDATNRWATLRLAEACQRAGVGRFIFTSVAATFGSEKLAGSSGGPAHDERSVYNLGDLHIPYLQSKLDAEQGLLELAASQGELEIIIANPSILIGPPRAIRNRQSVARGLLTSRAMAGLLHFYVDGRINLVDVRDVARTLLKLEAHGIHGERYLLAGHSVEIRELLDQISSFLPLGRCRVRIPTRALRWCARGQNLWSSARESSSLVDCLRLLDFGWEFSCEKTAREVGFDPTPIDDSLAEIFGWAEEHGRI